MQIDCAKSPKQNGTIVEVTVINLFMYVASVFAAEIHPTVLTEYQQNKTTDVLMFYQEQADVSAATAISDRTERIQFVYDRLREVAKRTQMGLIQELENEGLKYQRFYLTNAVLVHDVKQNQLLSLSARPEISYVMKNAQNELKLPRSPYDAEEQLNNIPANITHIKVDRVWNELGVTGEGIVIAGQDSGYEWDHSALKKKYRGYGSFMTTHHYNWHDAIRESLGGGRNSCGFDTLAPCDDNGHGTHTMGTMVGSVGTENRIGVAPDAKWIGCRNMDSGVGVASTYIECFEFFLAPYPLGGDPMVDGKPEHAPHVINNSWGCPSSEGCKGDEFVNVVRNLKAAGIMVVVSAGNDGSSCRSLQNPPGFYIGEVISVASNNHRNGGISYFSSRGPSKWNNEVGPTITAPGDGVRSAVPGNGYSSKSGTSMAGPHIAGVVALIWSAKPELIGKIDETIALMTRTADQVSTSQSCGGRSGNQVPNNTFGHGVVNAYEAAK